MPSWCPCAVSTTSTSTPAAASARALAATSPLMPTAAATLRRPDASTAGRYSVERRALRRESVPTRWPWCRTHTVSAPAATITSNAWRALSMSSASTDAARPRARSPRRASGSAVPRRVAGTTPRMSSMSTSPAEASATTMPWPSVGREQPSGIGDGRLRREDERRVPQHRLRLDPADRGVELLQRHVLGQHAEPAAAGEGRREAGAGDGVHVGRHERDRRGRAVARRQVDVEPARDGRAPRDEEDVRVGQIDVGRVTVELHVRQG